MSRLTKMRNRRLATIEFCDACASVCDDRCRSDEFHDRTLRDTWRPPG